VQAGQAADAALGRSPAAIAPPDSLTGLAELVAAVCEADEPVGLLVRSASRLTREPGRLSDREFEFYRRVERTVRDAAPAPHGLFNPVLWELDREQDLPTWLITQNEKLRSLVIPAPDAGERALAGERFVRRLPESPADLLRSPMMSSLLADLRTRYDYIVLDSPPLLGVVDARLAARLADAVLFVTRWEKTKEAAARTGLENLVDRHTPPIGAVLTQVDVRRHAKRGYGESVQYHSKYAAYYKS
jgi:hypothetical protein